MLYESLGTPTPSVSVFWFRCFFLDKIMEKLRGHTSSDSMEVGDSQEPASDIEAVVSECKFSMKLHMADSAWKQVNT